MHLAHPTSNSNPQTPDQLPSGTQELLDLFETGTSHYLRICALAKVKSQMFTSLQETHPYDPPTQMCRQVQNIFSNALIRFIRKSRPSSEEARAESKLLFHLVSLSIKYYYSEQAFKFLLGKVTDLIDRHSYRVMPALEFFTQIIQTVQSAPSARRQRCRFERHLTNEHINSMLTLANFCLERGVLPDKTSLQDGHLEEKFKIIAPENTLTAALQLVRACLCFDWNSEKYSEPEEVAEMGCLVLPTKRTRQVAESQFQKWLKNSEWMWVYQYLFRTGASVALKVQVVGLVGDLARIHMKFFKNKGNYRSHLENIVYCFSKMLEELELCRNSQQTIQIALEVLYNLNKVMSGSVGPMFFEINQNFWRGLLQILKKFIVYQLIGEEVFNSNLIFYSFTFLSSALRRSRFQQNTAHFETVEEVLRDVCRNYQQYLRILLNKIRKAPIRVSDVNYYRLDYAQLRDSLSEYHWKQLQVYFLPFQLMKPRYATANTIYEFFVYTCARICRAASLLGMFRLEKWEREVAHSMITQSVAKISERFSFTTYKKTHYLPRDSVSEDSLCPLPPISEHYEEEIDNEQQYCHMLRLTVFLVSEKLLQLSPESAMKVSPAIVRLVASGIQLCFCADLQEEDSQQARQISCRQKLEEGLGLFAQLLSKAYLRQYERALWQLGSSLRKLASVHVQYSFSDYTFVDLQLENEAADLLTLLSTIQPGMQSNQGRILTELRLLTLLCLDTQWPVLPEDLVQTVSSSLLCLQVLLSQDVLATLIKFRQPRILAFLSKMLRMLERVDYKQENLASVLRLLRVLAQLRAYEVSEEALNKLFVLLKFLLSFQDQPHLSAETLEQCSLLCVGVLAGNQEPDLQQLRRELQILMEAGKEHKRIDLEITCLSASAKLSEGVEGQTDLGSSCDPGQAEPEGEDNAVLAKADAEAYNGADKSVAMGEDMQRELYSGYHRDKTISVLAKYVQDHKITEPSFQIGAGCSPRVHSDPTSDLQVRSWSADTQFPEEIQPIEPPQHSPTSPQTEHILSLNFQLEQEAKGPANGHIQTLKPNESQRTPHSISFVANADAREDNTQANYQSESEIQLTCQSPNPAIFTPIPEQQSCHDSSHAQYPEQFLSQHQQSKLVSDTCLEEPASQRSVTVKEVGQQEAGSDERLSEGNSTGKRSLMLVSSSSSEGGEEKAVQ